MAKLALVKVGGAHLRVRGIVAIQPSGKGGSMVVYEGGVMVMVENLHPDTVFEELSRGVAAGVGVGFYQGARA